MLALEETQAKSKQEVSIFDYLDYRQFLRDWLEQAKQAYNFSYRFFSRKAGLRSPSVYKFVMDGDRNLTESSIKKFIRGLTLDRPEAEYFTNLVFFNQATSHDEKNSFYRKLVCSQEYHRLQPVARYQYDYYSTWYHPVVRELAISPEYDGTHEWIARRIKPSISSGQVAESLELLERMEFIKRTSDKESVKWEQSSPLVTSGQDASHIPLFNYYHSILELMRNRMTEVKPDQRDISALTLGIKCSDIPILKKKIEEFRGEILKLVSSVTEPEEVVLLSLQLLPVTATENKEERT